TIHAAVTGGSVLNASGNQTLTNPDTVSGLPAGCMQYPCMVAKVAPATYSSTSSTGNMTLYAVPSGASGLYKACTDLTVTVAGSASTNFQLYIVSTGD